MTGRTQRYARCMFKRVGAPQHLIRLYRVSQRSDHKDIALKFLFLQLFLGVFVCLQMSVYLLVAATSLWIDQLINGTLVNISTHNTVYLVSFTILNLVSFPLDYASYRHSFSTYQFLIPWITMVRVFGSAICFLALNLILGMVLRPLRASAYNGRVPTPWSGLRRGLGSSLLLTSLSLDMDSMALFRKPLCRRAGRSTRQRRTRLFLLETLPPGAERLL